MTTPRDTICWFVIEFFDKNKIQTAENIQRWKSQPAGEMCEALKDLPIPCGDKLTLADLMEETSRELLSKVMHEEKFFQTWYSSRAVLIGDGEAMKNIQLNSIIVVVEAMLGNLTPV